MKQSLDYKLIFALAAVGIIWGTTFLGIRVAVETIPPWFVTSIRQGLAGMIMMIILLFKKRIEMDWLGKFKTSACSFCFDDCSGKWFYNRCRTDCAKRTRFGNQCDVSYTYFSG